MYDKKIFKIIDNVLLTSDKPSLELNKIRKTEDFKKSSFNFLNKLEGIEQEKRFHPEGNVWNHVCMVVDMGAKVKEFAKDKRAFIWSTLLHDVGKITNTKFVKGRWRSYNHDRAGATFAKLVLDNISEDYTFNKNVEQLVRFHMHHMYIVRDLPFADYKELILTERINDIILVFLCDKLGRGNCHIEDKEEVFNDLKEIVQKIENYTGREYSQIREMINKIELMQI